jgi:hypothetical protein
MRIYIVRFEGSVSAAKTLIEIMNSANTLLRVTGLMIGQQGSEVSDQVVAEMRRLTATGTGTAATPAKTDQGDPAASFTAEVDSTVEPTAASEDPVWEDTFNLLAGVSKSWSYLDAKKVRPGTGNGMGLKLDLAPAAAVTIRAALEVVEEG